MAAREITVGDRAELELLAQLDEERGLLALLELTSAPVHGQVNALANKRGSVHTNVPVTPDMNMFKRAAVSLRTLLIRIDRVLGTMAPESV